MSMPLTIVIKKNQNPIATMYYRWSGTTLAALDEASKFLKYYNDLEMITCNEDDDIENDEVLRIIRISELFKGGLTKNSYDRIKQKYPDKEFECKGSSSYGICDVFEDTIQDAKDAATYIIEIDLDNDVYIDKSIDTFDSVEEFNEQFQDEKDKSDKLVDFDLERIPLYYIEKIYTKLSEMSYGNTDILLEYDGKFYRPSF